MYTLFVLDTYIMYISFSLVLPLPSSPRVSSPETAGWRTEPAVLGVSDIKHSTRMNLEERVNPPPPPPPPSPITGWAGLEGPRRPGGPRVASRRVPHATKPRAERLIAPKFRSYLGLREQSGSSPGAGPVWWGERGGGESGVY